MARRLWHRWFGHPQAICCNTFVGDNGKAIVLACWWDAHRIVVRNCTFVEAAGEGA